MANIVLNGKSVITQSSTDTPVLGPDILFPNGHVIQTIGSAIPTSPNSTTNTEIFTGLENTITIAAGNKVLIMVTQPFALTASSGSGRHHYIRLRRGSDATVANNTLVFTTGENDASNDQSYVADITFLDTPPGAGTYKYRTTMVTLNSNYTIQTLGGELQSFMILQEISSGVLDPNPIVKRTWQTKTNSESGYTAVSGDRLFVDTSSGTVTVTLPSSPAVGAFVRFVDVAGTFATNNLTIGRNSEKIMRSATDMTVSDSFSAFELVYSGSAHGWMITEI